MNRPELPGEQRAEAVALAYNAGQSAPTVVAKGRGLIATEIIARAKESGVYVHESPELVALLMQVDLDARIPPELYVAVAELLAWLYSIENSGRDIAAKTTAPKATAPESGAVTG
ncbi:EscU/YscU/HrcU family type III secretion system export apparatus switch protein [Zoogloea sp.]|uniref:EscU/YscU/HrcU family type III secretion system export apparatus switch protein n=1 Tax=Zoogloea sp. TaxID=49181 RepID=UPI0035B2E9B7